MFAGRAVQFLPVAHLDRIASNRRGRTVPHSAALVAGLFRYRGRLPQGLFHAHRIEIGAALMLGLGKRTVQFIHTNSVGMLGRHSESFWRKAPLVYRALEKQVLRRASSVAIFNDIDSGRIRAMRSDLVVTKTWFDPDLFDPLKRDER